MCGRKKSPCEVPREVASEVGPDDVPMAREASPDGWAVGRLVDIVGDRWRACAAQAEALADLLRQVLPARDMVALGDVWESAVVALSLLEGPLARGSASDLLARWLILAANRAGEWYRPRDRRPHQGRPGAYLAGDISEPVAGWPY